MSFDGLRYMILPTRRQKRTYKIYRQQHSIVYTLVGQRSDNKKFINVLNSGNLARKTFAEQA